MRLKGRYIPDDKIEIAPYIVEIPRGDGKTQLMVLEPETETEPIEPIKYFQWSKRKQPRKEKAWVKASVVGAFVSCVAATFGLLIAPVLSTTIILADLAWLAVIAFANR